MRLPVPRTSRTRVFVGAVAVVVFGLTPRAGVTQSPQPVNTAQLAERVNRELLLPVKSGLQEQLANDPKLAALVAGVSLNTLGTHHPHVGRNAVATTRGGPVILVDLVFLGELAQLGALGAVGLLRAPEVEKIVEVNILERDRQLAAAAQGRGLAPFQANLSGLGGDMARRSLVTRLGVEVSMTTAAWLVLHELAHHVRGHLAADPTSLAESRKWEEDADEWAYQKLYQLGYHLIYLDAFLQVQDVFEELELKHGLAKPEINSTHPLYATRMANLNRLYEVDKPSPVRMLSFLGFGWDSRGQRQIVETLIPRYPDEDVQLTATIWTGSTVASTVCDWVGSQAFIYGRTADALTQITVHNPERMRTQVTIVNRSIRTGQEQRLEDTWIQTTLAWARGREIANIPVTFVLESPVVTVLQEALRGAGVDAKTSRLVIGEYSAFFTTLRKGLVRYGRGEIELPQFATIMEARSAEFSQRLTKALGPTWTRSLEQQFLRNPRLLAMMDAVMKPR